MNTIDVLIAIESAEKTWGALIPNNYCPRRDIKRAAAKGFVESVGDCIVCDDDGFAKQPERYREGFRLTQAGKDRLERERSADEARQKGRIAMRLAGGEVMNCRKCEAWWLFPWLCGPDCKIRVVVDVGIVEDGE